MYHSLIQLNYFQYCNTILATHHTQHIELLFHKKAVRIVSLSKWNAHIKIVGLASLSVCHGTKAPATL